MKLQRLAQELLRHFALAPLGAGGGGGSGACCEEWQQWQVLLYPDLVAHGHLKNTSWGPAYSHDITVRRMGGAWGRVGRHRAAASGGAWRLQRVGLPRGHRCPAPALTPCCLPRRPAIQTARSSRTCG
jgi:hypothetical protein